MDEEEYPLIISRRQKDAIRAFNIIDFNRNPLNLGVIIKYRFWLCYI